MTCLLLPTTPGHTTRNTNRVQRTRQELAAGEIKASTWSKPPDRFQLGRPGLSDSLGDTSGTNSPTYRPPFMYVYFSRALVCFVPQVSGPAARLVHPDPSAADNGDHPFCPVGLPHRQRWRPAGLDIIRRLDRLNSPLRGLAGERSRRYCRRQIDTTTYETLLYSSSCTAVNLKD